MELRGASRRTPWSRHLHVYKLAVVGTGHVFRLGGVGEDSVPTDGCWAGNQLWVDTIDDFIYIRVASEGVGELWLT